MIESKVLGVLVDDHRNVTDAVYRHDNECFCKINNTFQDLNLPILSYKSIFVAVFGPGHDDGHLGQNIWEDFGNTCVLYVVNHCHDY